MLCFRRGVPFFPIVLLAAAVAIVVVAALTSWWALLFLMPLAMMLGCMTMMAGHRANPGSRAAQFGCCSGTAHSAATTDPEH